MQRHRFDPRGEVVCSRAAALALSVATCLSTSLALLPASATAAQRCADLPSPLYAAGGASVTPLLKALAPALLADADQTTLVYQTRAGCAAVEAVVRDTDPMTCQQGACIAGTATFFTQDGSAKTCDLPAGGAHLHVAFSDVFAQSCPALGGGVPRGVVDLSGPVSPLALVASRQSAEQSIQAEEAHFVFGFGKAGEVVPWNSEDSIIIRDERSAGQVLLGLAAQVPPGRFKGTAAQDEAEVINRVLAATPRSSIGFLPTVVADAHRGDLRLLAYQARGQLGAFFPDRTAATFDKRNVRDGHYALWGYLHVIGKADANMPDRLASLSARRLGDLVLGRAALGGGDPIALQIAAGLVPLCAMSVARLRDDAPLIPYAPTEPCGCYFEKSVTQGKTTCSACTEDKTCSGGRCRRGYCEER